MQTRGERKEMSPADEEGGREDVLDRIMRFAAYNVVAATPADRSSVVEIVFQSGVPT